jgi:WD40 repeat protein
MKRSREEDDDLSSDEGSSVDEKFTSAPQQASQDWARHKLSFFGGSRYAVTAVAAVGNTIVYGEKSGKVFVVDQTSGTRTLLEPYHSGSVLAVALSNVSAQSELRFTLERSTADSNTNYIVSGGADGLLRVWNAETLTHERDLSAHQGPVSGLVFRRFTATLYSCGFDGVVKAWSLAVGAVQEKLFGHKGRVNAIGAVGGERCVTGGDDRVPHYWKIDTVKNTEYAPQETAVESVVMLDDVHFVTGSSDGTLSVFDVSRRAPITTMPFAHGHNAPTDSCGLSSTQTSPKTSSPKLQAADNEVSIFFGNPISSLAAIPGESIFASGSHDGRVRVWRFTGDSIVAVASIRAPGFLNGLSFASPSLLVVGSAKEPRLGRWSTLSAVLNGLIIAQSSKPLDKALPTKGEREKREDTEFIGVKKSKISKIPKTQSSNPLIKKKMKRQRK